MPEQPDALDVIRHWPDVAREAGLQVLQAHGAPDELDDGWLQWDQLGPWKRVVVCADDDDDDECDVVESVVDARIADDRHAAIADEWHVRVEDDGEIAVR